MSAESGLASWRDTPTRQAIVDFVTSVTTEGGANYVSPPDRVAVFDNDGTLWSEKPILIELDFTLYRLTEQARSDSTLASREPYRAALERDYAGSAKRWSSTITATIVKAAVDVSGTPFVDLAEEARMAFARD